jgi:predicted NUDIX family NTP pyrophosphohydrolase
VPQVSAGILLYRRKGGELQVFLVHPGGPFWAGKDVAAWSIPKGLIGPDENTLDAARREFFEETGFRLDGEAHELGVFRQPSGKRIHVWIQKGNCNPSRLVSNRFEMSWPPKSGKTKTFPEVDRGGWFKRQEAMAKVAKGQRPIIEALFKKFG